MLHERCYEGEMDRWELVLRLSPLHPRTENRMTGPILYICLIFSLSPWTQIWKSDFTRTTPSPCQFNFQNCTLSTHLMPLIICMEARCKEALISGTPQTFVESLKLSSSKLSRSFHTNSCVQYFIFQCGVEVPLGFINKKP